MKHLLFAVLLIGCDNRSYTCETASGLMVRGYVDIAIGTPFECARLSMIEERLSEHFTSEEFVEIRGYSIWLYSTESYVDYWGREVGGWANCDNREIVIGTGTTVYAHELIHAIQKCRPEGPRDFNMPPEHNDWARKGYIQLIEEVSK